MNSRAVHWYLQRITGALLIVLLILHFWVEHFAADVRHGELTFDVVNARFLRNPWFVTVDIAFLLVALYHGLIGLRNIIYSAHAFGRAARGVITTVLVVVGIAWGIWGVTAFIGNDQFPKHSANISANSEAKLAAVR